MQKECTEILNSKRPVGEKIVDLWDSVMQNTSGPSNVQRTQKCLTESEPSTRINDSPGKKSVSILYTHVSLELKLSFTIFNSKV